MHVTGERGASPLAPGLTLQPTLPREQTDVGMYQLRAVTVTLSKSLTPFLPEPVAACVGGSGHPFHTELWWGGNGPS